MFLLLLLLLIINILLLLLLKGYSYYNGHYKFAACKYSEQ